MEAQEDSAEAQTGPEEAALEGLTLKKKCTAQSATNAAKNAKFRSGQVATSRFTAAIASEKMKGLKQEIPKGLNQAPPPRIIQNLKGLMKSLTGYWKY